MRIQGLSRFTYKPPEIGAIELTLSCERFREYVLRANGDRSAAVRLYEYNTSISESLYGVIQGLEVALRNAMDAVLLVGFGPNWFLDPQLLDYPLNAMAREAQQKVHRQRKPLTRGRTIAQLPFGFWTQLTGRRYEKNLWVTHLHKAFPRAVTNSRGSNTSKITAVTRQEISARLNDLRDLRNRIAHHERIIDIDLRVKYCDCIEAIRWVCPITAGWVHATNCFPSRIR